MDRASLKEIEAEITAVSAEHYPRIIEKYCKDERKSVRERLGRLSRKYDEYVFELKRIDNMKAYENSLRNEGIKLIAGMDEVGRGPLCGPVVSACVILPPKSAIAGVNDSKKLSEKKREELCKKILTEAIAVGVGIIDNNKIDEINILNATKLSMLTAVEKLEVKPEMILIDAVKIDCSIPQKSFIKGDENHYLIAAASIVAKVTRDTLMNDYDKLYPGYDLSSNKGYGSQKHIDAISEIGLSPIHRRSFVSGITGDTSYKTGRENEQRARTHLEKRGYIAIKSNYKAAGGEIDLIMLAGGTLVFIEVKASRYTPGEDPAQRVTPDKQQRLRQAAQRFIYEEGDKLSFTDTRFDIIAIELYEKGKYSIKHLQNAF